MEVLSRARFLNGELIANFTTFTWKMTEKVDDHEYHAKMDGVEEDVHSRKRKGAKSVEEDGKENPAAPLNKRRPEGGDAEGPHDDKTPPPPAPVPLSLEDVMEAVRNIGESSNKTLASVGELGLDMKRLNEKVVNIDSKADQAAATASEAKSQVEELSEELQMLKRDVQRAVTMPITQQYKGELRDMRLQLEKQEGYSRRFNIIIQGIPENDDETENRLYVKVRSFLNNNVGITDIGFDICHRLGAKNNRGDERDCRVIVKFAYLRDRNRVWEARSTLKNSNYRLILDKPRSVKEREALSFKIVKAAQASPEFRSAKFQYGKVWLDGVGYDFEEFEFLPVQLRPAFVSSPRNDKVIVFFSRFSPLSNHYWAPFELEGRRYVTVEQFLARSRAVMVRRFGTAARAMSTNDAFEHKRMLNQMREDGKDDLWESGLDKILVPALYAKFSQNPLPKEFLMNTNDRTIGEASYDLQWGIGVDLCHHAVLNEKYWTGNNRQEKALMEVRRRLSLK